jgi:hypothetical protein
MIEFDTKVSELRNFFLRRSVSNGTIAMISEQVRTRYKMR